jgi:hypothetical protein
MALSMRGISYFLFITRDFVICTGHPSIFKEVKSRRYDELGVQLGWGETRYTEFWWGNLLERYH